MDLFDDAPEQALKWHHSGKGAALATVIQTWGSAPRRVGAQMAVSGDGEMQGSVSGGCIEGAVVVEALDALEKGTARVLEYGISDGDAFAVGLACGGTIKIYIEPIGTILPVKVLEELVEARTTRVGVAYEVNIATGAPRLVHDGYSERFSKDRSGFKDDGQTFVAIHNPPLRLAIVGAVHIAQALMPMARIAGFDPVVIDPRGAFGSKARFPNETILEDWPDDALAAYGLDARTALVLLTHDPKLDDPALHLGLRSKSFYIGALGSKRTHAKRIERLLEDGFIQTQIDRIHGPIGLDIGAASPQEIAVSILSEMVQILRKLS
jgi:xanthine dehydrogenase accessory factor